MKIWGHLNPELVRKRVCTYLGAGVCRFRSSMSRRQDAVDTIVSRQTKAPLKRGAASRNITEFFTSV